MEITGISGALVDGNFEWPLIRVETDAGVVGYGEVRDHGRGHPHAETRYVDDPLDLALDLEDEVVGEDPTDVLGLVESIKRYGGWGRMGGGVSAIEMALWDITGKHLDVPAHELLGGAHREAVRVYCDCRAGEPVVDSATDYALDGNDYAPADYADHAAERAERYDFLKFDLDARAAEQVTGHAGVRSGSLTSAGLAYLESVVAAVHEAVPPDVDVGYDMMGMAGMPLKDAIAFGEAIEPYGVAALEDARPDDAVAEWKRLSEAITVPTITGEDLYLRDGFESLVREEAVDLVGPDLLTVGGIRETVRVAEFANAHGMPANLHFAASPVGFAATLQAAAAIEDLLAVEFHAVGVPWWTDLVEGTPFADGVAPVPDEPGLGVVPDEDEIRAHAVDGGFE